MQTIYFLIWIRDTESISYIDNSYSVNTSSIFKVLLKQKFHYDVAFLLGYCYIYTYIQT